MKRRDWPRWLKEMDIEEYSFPSFFGFKDGNFTIILESCDDKKDKTRVKMEWDNIYSYTYANESYREETWINYEDDYDGYGSFYKFEESPYISAFRENNEVYREEKVYHYMIVGEEVIDVLSNEEPKIYIYEDKNPINEFSEVNGSYVDMINGQSRFGSSMKDHEFFEIKEIIAHNGFYEGSLIKFYDFESGQIFVPFELEENVGYEDPVYIDGSYYFLKGDFNKGLVYLYEYYPNRYLYLVEVFDMEDLNLYNLSIIGKKVHLVSSDDTFEIYFPYRKSIELEGNETVDFIEDGKLYISAWVEEGWDDENHIAGPNYEYYDKLIIRDMDGNLIEERRGSLFQIKNGQWWLS